MRAPHSSAILLFFLSLSTRTAAQPVLASADIGYHVGDAYAFLACGPQSFPLTGAGLTWYYTNLSGWQSGTTTIVDPSTTEGASYFPSSTVADQYPGYPDAQYYTTTDTDQVWLGYYQGANIASVCSDPRTDLIWPFTYGSTFTDSLICDDPGVYHRTRYGEQTVSGEGYGTLVLPYGSFADCLLIHRHWNYFDDYDELVPGYVEGDTYSFYKAGIHAPLLSIGYSTYTQADSTIVNQGTSMISELSTGLGAFRAEANDIRILLDPETAMATLVRDGSEPAEVSVFTTNGTRLLDLPLSGGAHRASFSLSAAPAGVYLVRVTSAVRTGAMKIVRE